MEVDVMANQTLESDVVSPPSASKPLRVLRLKDVCERTGLGRSMIYQMEFEERFPKRVNVGTRAVGWVESEIQDWLAKCVAKRDRAAKA